MKTVAAALLALVTISTTADARCRLDGGPYIYVRACGNHTNLVHLSNMRASRSWKQTRRWKQPRHWNSLRCYGRCAYTFYDPRRSRLREKIHYRTLPSRFFTILKEPAP